MEREAGIRQQPLASCNTLRAHGGLIATHTHRRAKKASRPSNHIGAPHKRP